MTDTIREWSDRSPDNSTGYATPRPTKGSPPSPRDADYDPGTFTPSDQPSPSRIAWNPLRQNAFANTKDDRAY